MLLGEECRQKLSNWSEVIHLSEKAPRCETLTVERGLVTHYILLPLPREVRMWNHPGTREISETEKMWSRVLVRMCATPGLQENFHTLELLPVIFEELGGSGHPGSSEK